MKPKSHCGSEHLVQHPFLLERWHRDFYFDSEISLGGSGVQEYSYGEVAEICGIEDTDLRNVVLEDSPSAGGAEIRGAIARRWGKCDSSNVLMTHGSSEAIYLVMHALLRTGDEAIVLQPSYQTFSTIPRSIGCSVVPWKLRSRNHFAADLEELRHLITSRTRLIVVNFPNNPTGGTLSHAEYIELLDLTRDAGCHLMWDAAFSDLSSPSDRLPYPFASHSNAICVGTLSKAYGLSGLRVGWIVANSELVAKCLSLREYLTLNLSPLSEFIAYHAILHADRLVRPRLAVATRNLAHLTEWVESRIDTVDWVPPRGGVCALLNLSRMKSTRSFCIRCARDQRVFLTPGDCFGIENSVRIGFGASEELFKEGLGRVSACLDGMK